MPQLTLRAVVTGMMIGGPCSGRPSPPRCSPCGATDCPGSPTGWVRSWATCRCRNCCSASKLMTVYRSFPARLATSKLWEREVNRSRAERDKMRYVALPTSVLFALCLHF